MSGNVEMIGDLFMFHSLVPAESEDEALAGRQLIEGLPQPQFVLAGQQPIFHGVGTGVEKGGNVPAELRFAGHRLQHVEDLVAGDGKEIIFKPQDVGDLVAVEPDPEKYFLYQLVCLGGVTGQMESIGIDLTPIMVEDDGESPIVTFCYTGQQLVLIRQW